MLGGIFAFVHAGSTMSLMSGVTLGGLITLLGYFSMSDYLQNKKANRFSSPTYSYVLPSLVLSCLVSIIMADRYQKTENIAPAIIGGLSVVMNLFYLYKIKGSSDVGSNAERAYAHND